VAIAGGDTNSWDGPLVVSVTVLGDVVGAGPVSRAGARPGDAILCTGRFGGSIHGRHLAFMPRVREALALHAAASLHAMIDVSDGLLLDARRLCLASGVGLVLDCSRIPRRTATTTLTQALADGEDYELLVAVPAARTADVSAWYSGSGSVGLRARIHRYSRLGSPTIATR